MGLSLEFYAGDADIIGADFAAIDFRGLRDGTRARAYADFSLHISPTDLDTLSMVLGEHGDVGTMLLSRSLVRPVGAFGEEGGADLVDSAWVGIVATLEAADAPTLTEEWIEAVGNELGQSIPVTPEAVQAVRNLIELCRIAVLERLDVVRAWYL